MIDAKEFWANYSINVSWLPRFEFNRTQKFVNNMCKPLIILSWVLRLTMYIIWPEHVLSEMMEFYHP